LYACVYRPPAQDQPAGDARTLAGVAEAFSPRFEVHREDLVSIDVSGLKRLLGPSQTIVDELRRDAKSRGMAVHVAVAATRTTAMVLALARLGVTVVERGGEAAALAAVPIGMLEKIEEFCTHSSLSSQKKEEQKISAGSACSACNRWGVKTFGELASLPAADLLARLGPPARVWQAIARGEDLRPLIPTLADERFESSMELEWPIEGLEPLSFVVTRLLEPLSTRLERRDRGAAVLHVMLGLVTKDMHARRLELPAPMRDVRTLRTLALLDLEAHPPAAAIDRVAIVIDPTPGRVLQHTLFTRAHPTPEQLSTLVARLGALMGQDRFGAPAVVESYRPGAFAMAPFATEWAGKAGGKNLETEGSSVPPSVVSALRRCRHPVPARVSVVDNRPVRVTTDRRGFAGGTVVHCAGPWRTSGEWWVSGTASVSHPTNPPYQTHPTSWNRDEWDVSLNDGAVYRIFLDRERDAWFVDALVD